MASENAWDVQTGMTLLQLVLVGIFYIPLVSRAAIDLAGQQNRITYINVSIFSSLIFSWFLDFRGDTGNSRCWIFLSGVLFSPCLVIFPYFLMAIEFWGQEKRSKYRYWPMRMFSSLVGTNHQPWRAHVNILVGLVIYCGSFGLVIFYRYKQLDDHFEASDCSLGAQRWAVIFGFVCNVLIATFCAYLSYDCVKGKMRMLSFMVWEQNLVFLWSVVVFSIFLSFFLNPQAQEWAEARGFKNYEIFIYIHNLGPVLFSCVLSYFLSLCSLANKLRPHLWLANKLRNKSRYSAAYEQLLFEQTEMEDMSESEDIEISLEEPFSQADATRFARSPVAEKRIADATDNNGLCWFIKYRSFIKNTNTDILQGTNIKRIIKTDIEVLEHLLQSVEDNITKDGFDQETLDAFVATSFPLLIPVLAKIPDLNEKVNRLHNHICVLWAVATKERIQENMSKDLFEND